jgi:hypothetical protein
MRIAISGSACQGKTTLIDDFLKQWPNYKRSPESYRKLIRKKGAKINKEGTKESQWTILNSMFDDLQNTSKDDYIIYDRCCLDNLVYSLWHNAKQTSNIDDEFIKKCIPIVQQSMHFLDIIFFLPITRVAPVPITPKKHRETDPEYIKEIDNIFKVISHGLNASGKSPFFPDEDRPPIIEIFGNPQERVEMIKLYLNADGDLIDEEQGILSPENISQMETLLNVQKQAHIEEKEEQKFYNEITKGIK